MPAAPTASPTSAPYHVYVIELPESVGGDPKVRRRNLQRNLARPCVYVGQTAKDPETRLDEHRRGYKANAFVHAHGGELMTELCVALPEGSTRDDALRVEERVARQLRRRGFGVWWG